MKDNVMHGEHEFYYPSGQLQSRGFYKNGLADGIIEHFYESGQLQSRANWSNGKEHGEGKIYFDNGKLNFSATYENGNLVGTSIVYFETGVVKERKLYDRLGNLIHVITYNEEGVEEKRFVVPTLKASRDTVRVNEPLFLAIKFNFPLSGIVSIQASETDSIGNIVLDPHVLQIEVKDSVTYRKTFNKAGTYKLSFLFKHSGRAPGDSLTIQNVKRDYSILVVDEKRIKQS